MLWAQEKYRLDHLSAVGYAADVAEQRGIQIGEQRGIQIGEQRGKLEGKLEIARALLAEGAPMSMIAKCTGFRISELEKLRK
jgi:predicted transposase/invertase (TIGR01784 family)